jgi:glycosyltransferase involved in cell wall biosynthesis
MPQALYFYHAKASFVEKDLHIFQKRFDEIKEFSFGITDKFSVITLMIKQLVFLLKNIGSTHFIICQFVGYHTLLPVFIGKVFGKKIILIPGGIDCAKFPSINYGNYTKKWLGKITNYSYQNASIILPVHECMVLSDYTYQTEDLPQQGITVHCKGLTTPIKVIHNGYDATIFNIKPTQRIQHSFITIASNLDNKVRAKIKGVDLIIEVATLLPQCHFYMIGISSNINNLPKNVTLIPFVPNHELPALLSNYEFYLQLSMSEGFPNALSEAMLCGCIPIGSAVTSIPEIIGDTGFILGKKDPQFLKQTIENALQCNKEKLSAAARNRIIENYSLAKREKELLLVIDSLNN